MFVILEDWYAGTFAIRASSIMNITVETNETFDVVIFSNDIAKEDEENNGVCIGKFECFRDAKAYLSIVAMAISQAEGFDSTPIDLTSDDEDEEDEDDGDKEDCSGDDEEDTGEDNKKYEEKIKVEIKKRKK